MKILSKPKGNAEEYGRWSVNPYKGCPHGCQYCYLKKGPGAKNLGGDSSILKSGVCSDRHAYHIAMAEILENEDAIRRDGGLFMTFTSDPLIRENRDLMLSIAFESIFMKIPVVMLTKDATFLDVSEAMAKMLGADGEENWRKEVHFWHVDHRPYTALPNPHFDSYADYIAFGFTLTGHDEMEPKASSSEERINTMRRLNEMGFKTWASIEPVIDFDSSFAMIQQALDAGCKHFKIGLLTNNTKVVRSKYDMVECCQFVGYVMELTERYGATVYWKQSFVDFLQVSKKDPQPVHGMTAREFLSQWKHSVGKDWSMFKTSAV